MDRTANYGAASFEADADRVDSIAAVFPFIFFLVAALVALTTMTRMVEEERALIGTFKALGTVARASPPNTSHTQPRPAGSAAF